MASWWLWPGQVFWKAKAAGSGHGFNLIKFSLKILKKFHFVIFFGLWYSIYSRCWGGFLDTELVWLVVEKFIKKKIIKFITTYIPKSLGLGQARPRPSRVWGSQSHIRPGQSRGFQAKPGRNSTSSEHQQKSFPFGVVWWHLTTLVTCPNGSK